MHNLKLNNIINIENINKFLRNPLKGFKVFYKIMSDYPRIQSLPKIEASEKKKRINFYKKLVKKNNNLNNFFFNQVHKKIKCRFSYNDFEGKKDEIINSLVNNGIVIISDILNETELSKIDNIFFKLENRDPVLNFVDAAKVKYGTAEDVEVLSCERKIDEFETLKKYSDFFTKNIFGRKVKTKAEFYYHKSLKKEVPKFDTDTYYHLDRYLPCLKIIFTANKIDAETAPFCILKGSHKLDNNKINEFLINNNTFKISDEEIAKFGFEEEKTICERNSIIISFTNGFHKREIFKSENKIRKTVFFQYTDNFNKFSLYNFFLYNYLKK